MTADRTGAGVHPRRERANGGALEHLRRSHLSPELLRQDQREPDDRQRVATRPGERGLHAEFLFG